MAKVMDKTDEQAPPEVLHFTAAERAARARQRAPRFRARATPASS